MASAIIRSYLDDLDVHDPNDPDATAHAAAALRFLQTLQARFVDIVWLCCSCGDAADCSSSVILSEECASEVTRFSPVSSSEMEVFNRCCLSSYLGNIRELDSQVGLFGVHAAAGSLHAFSASMSGRSLSSQVVTVLCSAARRLHGM